MLPNPRPEAAECPHPHQEEAAASKRPHLEAPEDRNPEPQELRAPQRYHRRAEEATRRHR